MHNVCGNQYKVKPNSFLMGKRCPKCAKTSSTYKGMEWSDILKSLGNFEEVDAFIDNKTPTSIKCLDCGGVFSRSPANMKRSKKCPYCAKKSADAGQASSQEEFLTRVKELVGDEFTVIGEYKGTHIPVEIRHNLCGRILTVRPHEFLSGNRCRSCSRTKTTEQFKDEVKQLEGNNYQVMSKYMGDAIAISMRHNVCGYEYKVRPNSFLQGNRCPKCNKSRGEAMVERVLISLGIDYIPQFKFGNLVDKSRLSYDFYLPKHNVLIEYQGIQHYKPIQIFGGETSYAKQKVHDRLKKEYAEENNFKLLEIKYTEKSFDSIKTLILNSIS